MTYKERALKTVHDRLFSDSNLRADLSDNINYARGPVTATWPQLHWFEVATTTGYMIDFDSLTVQFSVWALDGMQALRIMERVKTLFLRWRGIGDVEITWSSQIDAGALPTDDQKLKGQFLRVQLRYRGENVGG